MLSKLNFDILESLDHTPYQRREGLESANSKFFEYCAMLFHRPFESPVGGFLVIVPVPGFVDLPLQ